MEDQPVNVKKASSKPRKRRKKRSQAQKVGRIKYAGQRLRAIELRLDQIERRLRFMMHGLRGIMVFPQQYLTDIVCKDAVDHEILTVLRVAGRSGILPKEIVDKLSEFGIKEWHVRRRMRRMNRKLQKELGVAVAERRGWRWALTSFMYENYTVPLEELGEKTE